MSQTKVINIFYTNQYSGHPGLVDTIDVLTHVLHIYLSPTIGTRLQSAALSDSESGLKRSGQGQKHSGSAHGIRGINVQSFCTFN